MRLTPCSVSDARRFVAAFHRHNRPPAGGVFAVGLEHDAVLIGVAIAGRPVARALDDGRTLEVTRCCTSPDAPKGAVSCLYGACRRAAGALGYARLLTYTLASESGASLRGVGWQQTAFLQARGGWSCPSRLRGAGTVDRTDKLRWEVSL